jgi:hypothetical protein
MRSRFHYFPFFCCTLVPLFGQGLEPDAAGCIDSKIVPKLAGCRIDNCENKDSDHRDVATREDEKGEPVTSVVEGESRSVMYECREGTTPAGVVQQAMALLRDAHFEIPYHFTEQEGEITAQKGELWVLLEAASRYYTLIELKAAPSEDNAADAVEMAEAIERDGHVAIYGVEFLPEPAKIAPGSEPVLREVAAMLEEHSEWRVRIDARTEPQSQAIVAWLVGRGIERTRLEASNSVAAQPETGKAKNSRIDLVKIGPALPH